MYIKYYTLEVTNKQKKIHRMNKQEISMAQIGYVFISNF